MGGIFYIVSNNSVITIHHKELHRNTCNKHRRPFSVWWKIYSWRETGNIFPPHNFLEQVKSFGHFHLRINDNNKDGFGQLDYRTDDPDVHRRYRTSASPGRIKIDCPLFHLSTIISFSWQCCLLMSSLAIYNRWKKLPTCCGGTKIDLDPRYFYRLIMMASTCLPFAAMKMAFAFSLFNYCVWNRCWFLFSTSRWNPQFWKDYF